MVTRTRTCIALGTQPPGSKQPWASGSAGGLRFWVASVDVAQLEGWLPIPPPGEIPDGKAVKHHDGSWLCAVDGSALLRGGHIPCMWRHEVPGRSDDDRLAARIAGVLGWAVGK